MKGKVSIYVRNQYITPSSYYRIIQYAKSFDQKVLIRNIAPSNIYNLHLNSDKKTLFGKLIGIIYYLVMLLRVSFFVLEDLIIQPDYVILSKTFIPRYCPGYLRLLLNILTSKTTFYWDFDDYIFESGEISQNQAKILMRNSNKIIVTNNFLKNKIDLEYREKVILLPTTDGDLQGYDELKLLNLRKNTFESEIRLVWVATAGNIPHLLGIIGTLDETAEKVNKFYNKTLTLTVVCNKPLVYETQHLKINNIRWTREIAKDEIYKSHIGIMPLNYSQYSLGKGGFKLVQYMSTGLPVIGSKVGYNEEIVSNGAGILVEDNLDKSVWVDAIMKICESFETWESYSKGAYERWKSGFSYDYNLKVWKSLLNEGHGFQSIN